MSDKGFIASTIRKDKIHQGLASKFHTDCGLRTFKVQLLSYYRATKMINSKLLDKNLLCKKCFRSLAK